MRIPLPKSKLVTLAVVAFLGSGVAAASLAAPSLWSEPTAAGAGASQRVQSIFAFDDEREDFEDDEWEPHDDDFDDD